MKNDFKNILNNNHLETRNFKNIFNKKEFLIVLRPDIFSGRISLFILKKNLIFQYCLQFIAGAKNGQIIFYIALLFLNLNFILSKKFFSF